MYKPKYLGNLTYITSLSIIVITLSVAYYFFIFVPKQADIKLEQAVLERENSEDEKNTKLRIQAVKECEEVMTAGAQAIAQSNGANQQKMDALEKYLDSWRNTFEERCIQNKVNQWKGE